MIKFSIFWVMKGVPVSLCVILIGVIGQSCSHVVPSKDSRQNFLDRGIDSVQAQLIFDNAQVFPNKTQLAIALVNDSTTIFVGLEKRNDTLVNIENRDADFEIGAVSMVFTSTLLANFVVHGKIALDDSLSSHIPISLKDSLNITFQQLVNHTSGLPRVPTKMLLKSLFKMNNPYKDFDDTKMMAFLQSNVELDAVPGSTFAYSNLGMGVLGFALGKVGKEPFGQVLEEDIFKPYKLSSTTTNRKELQDSLVVGLNKYGKKTSNWDMAAMAGAGAVISTASDMAKFAKAQFNPEDKILALTRKKTFTIDDNTSIGMGWNILRADNGDTWFTQRGGTGGYSASVALDTLNHTAVIVLSNVSASNENQGNIEKLCFGLMKTLKPDKPSDTAASSQ